jgi:hypothetical protein
VASRTVRVSRSTRAAPAHGPGGCRR